MSLAAPRIAFPFAMTMVYAVVPPPVSNVMILRLFTGNGMKKDWVSLAQISLNLPRHAVIASEDARFCEHRGVDWIELQGVIDEVFDDDEDPVRGASTIPMQTAKNLFLWDGRQFTAKAWSSHWPMDGPGLVEAADDRNLPEHRGMGAWRLWRGSGGATSFQEIGRQAHEREAALLAAVLPNPIKRNAGKPSKRVSRIRIVSRCLE